MCNACGFFCCGSDAFEGCGCDQCPNSDCWPDDVFYDEQDGDDDCDEGDYEAGAECRCLPRLVYRPSSGASP